jgi:hypothetical protein
MITQTTFTNAILVAISVMALIVTADPPEKQKHKITYFIVMIVGSIFIGGLFMLLTNTFPS